MEICILRRGNSLRTEQNVTEHQEVNKVRMSANELMLIRCLPDSPSYSHTYTHESKKDFDLMMALDKKSLILQ